MSRLISGPAWVGLLPLEDEDVVPLGVVENGPRGPVAARVRFRVDDAACSDRVDRSLEIVHFKEHSSFVARGIGLDALLFKAEKSIVEIELGVMSRGVFGQVEAQSVAVEAFGGLQVVKIKLHSEKARFCFRHGANLGAILAYLAATRRHGINR
jgi:hypothetical protein